VKLLFLFSPFVLATALAAAAPPAATQLDDYAAGFAAAYNLDNVEARERFEAILRRSPDDGRAHRGLATVAWLEITFARGTVTADEFLGGSTRTDVQLPPATRSPSREIATGSTPTGVSNRTMS
jgi:hypothetical protein